MSHLLSRGLFALLYAAVLAGGMAFADETDELKLAAEKGDVKAQQKLGAMYYYGKDTKDDVAAAKWFALAADQGSAYAQFNMGTMAKLGHGGPKDLVRALMWFNLAAVQGFQNAGENRDAVAKLLTPEQIAEANALARDWKPSAKK